MDAELIKDVAEQLEHGDQVKIAKRTGLHKVTVNRFFKGHADVSDDTAELIINESEKIIKRRQKRRSRTEQKAYQISKSS